jgi:hypothetical protein
MRYLELYLAGLYDALEAGGKQEAVDRAIAEINNPTPEGLVAWLQVAKTTACPSCGTTFTLATDVQLDQEVLCPTCAKPAT